MVVEIVATAAYLGCAAILGGLIALNFFCH